MSMRRNPIVGTQPVHCGLILVAVLAFSSSILGQSILKTERDTEASPRPRALVLPYAFYTDSTDFAVGLGGGMSGYYQPQLFIGGAAFVSTNGSFGAYGIGHDLQLSADQRWFLDGLGGVTRYDHSSEYVDGNPDFANETAGSNDSSEDNFVEAQTLSAQANLTFKYILPIGSGRETPVPTYTLDHGVLRRGASGGDSWNPMKSGRTFLEIKPFAYWRDLESDDLGGSETYDSNGIELKLRWDNSDFPVNPTRGNIAFASVARDFSLFHSAGQYTTIEAGYSQFIPLGQNDLFKQQVLALSAWGISEVAGDAPYYTGATLGGYERLRGYPFGRFSGGAAWLTTAELRLMLDWNPLREWKAMDRLLETDWIQLVTFLEVGRVGDSFEDDLFRNPRWDAGVGIRMMSRRTVLRADVAVSEEGASVWVMVGQAF